MAYCVVGDLFELDIDNVLKQGFTQYGEHWKLWGKWVYDDADNLIALFSKGYGKNGMTGAYVIKPQCEKEVLEFAF